MSEKVFTEDLFYWEDFQTAIQRAVEPCEASGDEASDHFRGVTKMLAHAKELV